MGFELVQRLDAGFKKLEWKGEIHATPLGEQIYEMGLDIVDDYVEDIQKLNKALKTFRSGDSLPFALAGIAYLLLAASQEADGHYEEASLAIVLDWLEQAQVHEPDRPEINFIEARIYIFGGELDNARIVLDYLIEQSPYYYYLNVTEALYWQAVGDIDKMVSWYGAAGKFADNVPKQVRLHEKIGDAYFEEKRFEEALESYRQALHFSAESGRLWHKVSVIHWELDEIEACKKANARALEYGYGAEAEEMRNLLRRQLGTTAFLRRMLGSG